MHRLYRAEFKTKIRSVEFYRDSIDFAHRQLAISEELDSPNMRAEAYLHLARAHERLGDLDRALAYARHRYKMTYPIFHELQWIPLKFINCRPRFPIAVSTTSAISALPLVSFIWPSAGYTLNWQVSAKRWKLFREPTKSPTPFRIPPSNYRQVIRFPAPSQYDYLYMCI